MHKRVLPRIPVKTFFSHFTEKTLRETLLCLRKVLVSKNVRDKRGRGHRDLPSNMFCLMVPKKFIGEPTVFQKSSVAKAFIDKRGQGGRQSQDFPSELLSRSGSKSFLGEL